MIQALLATGIIAGAIALSLGICTLWERKYARDRRSQAWDLEYFDLCQQARNDGMIS